MARPVSLLPRLVVVLFLAATSAAHEETFPFDGVLCGLVDEALGPDAESASAAREALVSLGAKAAPYLLVARENLPEGRRLDPVIDEILRAGTGPDAPFPGALEVPATDGEVFDLWVSGIRKKATASATW